MLFCVFFKNIICPIVQTVQSVQTFQIHICFSTINNDWTRYYNDWTIHNNDWTRYILYNDWTDWTLWTLWTDWTDWTSIYIYRYLFYYLLL